jgi:prepilin signal peptidase PulO-like enzyme (type II secretory pathway)
MDLFFSGTILISVFALIFGSIIGSFLNVVILRHNTRITKKRSFCFSCGHTLEPIELIPIVSYIAQGGKCKKCHSKISPQYFIVELVFAIISVITLFISIDANIYFWVAKYVLTMAIFGLLTCTFVYDLKHKIMPDVWTLGAFILALIYSAFFGIGLKLALVGMFIVAIPLLLVFLISKGRAMGFGDVKFTLFMGMFLGSSAGLLALMFSFWIGGIVGCYLLIMSRMNKLNGKFKKIDRKSEIAFGPFLIVGTFFVFIFNLNIDILLTWLLSIL